MPDGHSQLTLGPMPVGTASPRGEISHPATRERDLPAPGERISLTQLLAASVKEGHCSEKAAAIAQGYDPRYWPRIKSGEKRAYLDPVGDLPEPVQRAFVRRYAEQLGMRVTEADAQRRAVFNLLSAAAEAARELAG